MTNPRASVELRRALMGQIRALRRRIDPRLLERVRDAVYATEHPEPLSEKDSARAAVAAFLAGRSDGGAFRAKLAVELEQAGRNLDALLPPPPGEALPPSVTRLMDQKPLGREKQEAAARTGTPKAKADAPKAKAGTPKAPSEAPKEKTAKVPPAKEPPAKKRLFWGWF